MRLVDALLPCRCPVCGALGAAPCGRCAEALPPPPLLGPPAGIDACVAVVAYDGTGRDLVAALKFRGEHGVARWAASVLAAAALREGPDAVVTWVPTSGRQRRRRGADQAEVLARALGAAAGLPVRRLLLRRPGPPQAGRSAAERRRGPALAPARRAPPVVVLVDDVVTTGGSVTAAARALRGAGAQRIVVAALARTPP